jgi:hypothetical protein
MNRKTGGAREIAVKLAIKWSLLVERVVVTWLVVGVHAYFIEVRLLTR